MMSSPQQLTNFTCISLPLPSLIVVLTAIGHISQKWANGEFESGDLFFGPNRIQQ
jgi:hypothetical protein